MKKPSSAGVAHVPPLPGTRGYIRVVARGCGGYRDSYTLEYDCSHRYTWTCDDCPVLLEKYKEEIEAAEGKT